MITVDEVREYSSEMSRLLRGSRYATYLTYLTRFDIPEEHIYSLLDNDIQSLIDSEGSTSLVATDNGRLRGILVGRLLEWDSAHFGFPCYKINYLFSDGESEPKEDVIIKRAMLAAFKKEVAQQGARTIMGRAVGGDWGYLWALESEGFNIVDTLVVFAKNITKPSIVKCDLPFPTRVTKGCPPDLLPKLKSLVSGAFPASRFMVDFRFPTGSGEQMYLEWLERIYQQSAEHGEAYIPVHSEEGHKGEHEKLLILEKGEDEVAGFITYKDQKALGMSSIELIISNPQYRGIKVSDHLIRLIEDELRSEAINILEVTAYLYNYPAINVYVRSSFSPVSSIYTLHLWL